MNATPHQKPDFNVEIGKRLMLIRLSANLSQGELGDKIYVSAQQVHKYETGENRLSAETIKELVRIFGVSVSYFYADDDILNSDLDKSIISITSEIVNFPEDVRGDLLSLVKSVKRMVNKANT